MDIVALETMYDGTGLLIVDVRFAGNVNGLIGRGQLRRAMAGIVLEQRGARRTTIVTAGARARARAAERGPADAVLVDRDRHQIRFVVSGVTSPRRVTAATIPQPRARGPRVAQSGEIELIQLFLFEFAFQITAGIESQRDEAAQRLRDHELLCALAKQMDDEMWAEERELDDRATREEGARRARIEAVIDRLLAAGRGVRDKVASCTAPGGGPPEGGGLPEDFKTSYAHGMGRSRICVYVTGRSAQTGWVIINGTAEPTNTKSFQLDAEGRATVYFEITSLGNYPVDVEWIQADGTMTTRTGVVTVNPGPPSEPPPAGFAPCPPP